MSDEVIEQEPIPLQYADEWKKNPMRRPRLKALIINSCVGESGPRFERTREILRQITNCKPVERVAKRSERGFG
ncbi:MAG: 50S ribosomal protein L5, partial [Candidatus Heimdallarchaeota archaeon]|nr:50S ribosomal protein L5 [Candidatus Heimdallarchaeota archaeon]